MMTEPTLVVYESDRTVIVTTPELEEECVRKFFTEGEYNIELFERYGYYSKAGVAINYEVELVEGTHFGDCERRGTRNCTEDS